VRGKKMVIGRRKQQVRVKWNCSIRLIGQEEKNTRRMDAIKVFEKEDEGVEAFITELNQF